MNELPELNSSASYSYTSKEMQLALTMYINAFYPISNDYELKFFWEQAIKDLMLYTRLNASDLVVEVIDRHEINAFAMPGLVGLNVGIIESIDRFEEAIFIFAHELAHIQQGHHSRKYEDQNTGSFLTYLAALALGGAPLLLGSVAAKREMSLAFSRELEYEADNVGVDVMSKAGYDPQYAISSLEKLDKYGDYDKAKQFEYYQTHPITPNRIKEVRSYVSAKDSYVNALYSRVRREANAKNYLLLKEKYKVIAMSRDGRDAYIRKNDGKNDVILMYGVSHAHRLNKNYTNALKISEKLLEKSSLNSLYSYLNISNLSAVGRNKEAINKALDYLSLNSASVAHHLLLGEIYMGMGDFKKAETSMLAAVREMDMVPEYWEKMMFINKKLKNNYEFYFSYASKLFAEGRLKECDEIIEAAKRSTKEPEKLAQLNRMQSLVRAFLASTSG